MINRLDSIFWNEAKEEYPNAMLKFYNWLSEYKKTINYLRLFNPKYISIRVSGHAETLQTNDSYPSFLDLPLAIQVGIFVQFISETQGNSDENILYQVKTGIEEDLQELELELNG